jgi:beta-lactam-binding protein with PASTA domain
MPDLRGRTLRQALAMLAPLDVSVKVAGRGRVVGEQAPPPGETLDAQTGVRLVLAGAVAR